MSCVLRLSGSSIDTEKFQTTFGTLLPKGCIVPSRQGGINLVVETASLARLHRQIEPTLAFLHKHKTILKNIMNFEGVEGGTLDFGIAIDPEKVTFNFTNQLPPALVQLAAEAGLAIELTFYVGPEEPA